MASNIHYHVDDRVSLLEENARGIYDTPGTYSAQWSPPPNHGDLGSPEYEMRTRMGQPVMRNDSETSMPSMGGYFPKQPHVQTSQYDPLSKVETGYSATTPVLYEESSGRQLRHILIGSSFRWGITAALCTAYILVTILWNNRGPVDENSKKIYNTITTGISIALGLNIASAFKDMALNMRWPILSHQKRSLKELDLILHSDSMQSLAKLAITSKGPWVIVLSIFWLLINIAAQVGIAACSLTYGFDTDFDAVLFTQGPVLVANMTRFFTIGSNGTINNYAMFETFNEDFTAHTYGGLPYYVSSVDIMPTAGNIYKDSNPDFWFDTTNNYFTFLFLDNPVDLGVASTFSAYSSRHINVSTVCEAHKVTANGNLQDLSMGTNITVGGGIGTITVADEVLSNATTYFTFGNNICESGTRCTTVQVLEASDDDPWYYRCNTTLTPTQDDPYNVSFVDDRMAQVASSSIAQIGFLDAGGHASQVYPLQSLWGQPMHGDTNFMAYGIGSYAMGSIWGAHNYNPTFKYNGNVPTSGQKFSLNHNISFYLVLGALMGSQFFFCIVVAFAANRVTVGPEKHLGMGLLLRPVSNHLESVSGGKENRAYKHATKHTHVIYEKGPNGKWGLSLT